MLSTLQTHSNNYYNMEKTTDDFLYSSYQNIEYIPLECFTSFTRVSMQKLILL